MIGRLAVDINFRGQRLGEKLLVFAFEKALAINEMSGIQAIVVDTIDAEAEAFYDKYGFQKIEDTKNDPFLERSPLNNFVIHSIPVKSTSVSKPLFSISLLQKLFWPPF